MPSKVEPARCLDRCENRDLALAALGDIEKRRLGSTATGAGPPETATAPCGSKSPVVGSMADRTSVVALARDIHVIWHRWTPFRGGGIRVQSSYRVDLPGAGRLFHKRRYGHDTQHVLSVCQS